MSPVTAADVLAEARRRHGDQVGASELGTVYEELMAPEQRRQRAAYYTPLEVAGFMSRVADAYISRALGYDAPHWRPKVLPEVITSCIFGVDIDPVAADLSRLTLSLLTEGALTPGDLERHVVCDSVLDGPEHLPPAYIDAGGGPILPGPNDDVPGDLLSILDPEKSP